MKINTKVKDIRKEARLNLKGNWGKAIGVVVVYFIIAMIVNKVLNLLPGHLFKWFSIVIVAPLVLGMVYFFLNLPKGNQGFQNLFHMASREMWIKSIIIQVILSIGMFLSFLVFLVPMTLITHVNKQPTTTVVNPVSNMNIVYIGVCIGLIVIILIILALLIPFIIYMCTFSLVSLIAVDRREMKVLDVFRESAKLMKGNKKKYFLLQLSYIGWAILSILSLGIGFLWLAPYVLEGKVVFYNEIKKDEVKEEIFEKSYC